MRQSRRSRKQIQQSLDDNNLGKATIKRKDCVKPIEALGSTVKIDQRTEFVNPAIFFTRLTAIAQRQEDVESSFHYELAVYPPSLHGNMIFYQEREQKGWNVSSMISQKLGDIKEHLLFVHAWSGCDTVSATFGKGKATFLNQLKKSEKLKDISMEMNDTCATQDDICAASEVVFGMIYGGKPTETLKKLRLVACLVCKHL